VLPGSLWSSIFLRACRDGGWALAVELSVCPVAASSEQMSEKERGRWVVAGTSWGWGAASWGSPAPHLIEQSSQTKAKG